MNDVDTTTNTHVSETADANNLGKTRSWLIFGAAGLFAAIVFGLLYLFVLAPSVPNGNLGWFLFSFATGLTMIVLPCTLPLAFVIVPLSMGKGLVRGLGMALAFGIGVATTLSLYGVAAALLGGIAIDALGADLESVKNWVYFIAGVFALVFALSEIGLMNVRMPTYSGAAPAFIQKRGEIIKAFLLGLFLGNVGVGCPHPATPLILIEIASSGDVLYGWSMFLVHALGRILPLLLLAFLAILGVNGLNWLMSRKESVEKATGWAMVFVAGFILTLGLFSHDWWVNSGLHSGLETITQEAYFNQLLNDTLDTNVEHLHGLEEGAGLFGLPLEWGSWFLVMLWLVPIWWWYRKRKEEAENGTVPCDTRVLTVKRNFLVVISLFIILTFVYFLPKNFYLTSISGVGHGAHGDTQAHDTMMTDVHVMTDGTMPGSTKRQPLAGGTPFTKNLAGLPEAVSPTFVELSDGDTYTLTASYVQKEIGNRTLRMLAYNGSIPGPFIKAAQGAEITINFTNNTDIEQTIHSHGIRIDNNSDGVPYVTQDPVAPGGSHTYTIKFADAGVYWYHPHTRDDYGQELGLYGNYLVEPLAEDYWNNVNREVPLVIDDILIEDEQIVDFYREFTNFALLGRFGNTLLVNGEQDFTTTVEAGEVIRFLVTNVSNARPYNLSIPGAQIKLVGADIGRYEREIFVDSFVLSPAERTIIEVYFEKTGTYKLVNTFGDTKDELARFLVQDTDREPVSYIDTFNTLRQNHDVVDEFQEFRSYLNTPPDKRLLLTIDLNQAPAIDHGTHGHADVGVINHTEHAHTESAATRLEAVQWEDPGATDYTNTSEFVVWKLIDEDTGASSMGIPVDDWTFTEGTLVKVRLTNDADADHVMQHPMHFHGQQFVVLSENGVPNDNMAWKDTVLVYPGETVDVLVDMSNLGEWMSHCHISEHLHAGMMMQFRVEDETGYATGDEYRATVSVDRGHQMEDPGVHMDDVPMHMMDTTNELGTLTGKTYAYDDRTAIDHRYGVELASRTYKANTLSALQLSFVDTSGAEVALSSTHPKILSVYFVKSDGSFGFGTYPGNTTFPEAVTPFDNHGEGDGHDHVHSFLGIPTAHADTGHATHEPHDALNAGTIYSVPVQFPAPGTYRGFVEFIVAGEDEPRVASIDVEVSDASFSVDNYGWSPVLKWWILLLSSIVLMLPLIFVVRRYIDVKRI